MSHIHSTALTRRSFLASATAAVALFLPRPTIAQSAEQREFQLVVGKTTNRLLPEPHGQTDVWSYNGSVPGPEFRVRQGDRLRVAVKNALDEETTIHWHGIRTPNSMDGVPHLTQRPIAPGETFVYEFDAVDAGTFWYHPHQRSFEQLDRGLYGSLIVEEAEPIRVDRDVTWVLDDWRLSQSGQIRDDFGNRHDVVHSGRIGNAVTINGQIPSSVAVRKGERIRLRLINAANARIFALDFSGHEPLVVALDGQPVEPHSPADGLVVLGSAMRVDLILDMTGSAGTRFPVVDRFYEGLEYDLVDLSYEDRPLRSSVPDWPVKLAANPLPEPDLDNARHHQILFSGGMMGQMVMQEMGASMGGSSGRGMMGEMMDMMRGNGVWFVNGVAAEGHVLDPLLTLKQGTSHVLEMTNATAWHHPIHLHGHSFRVVSRNGEATRFSEWQDTVLMAPRERVAIAFVADNPGDWMFHCHILEHQASGMAGVIRVA